MLKIADIQSYDITTPLAKKNSGINSTSTDAYTWIATSGKPFDTISPYVYQGVEGVVLWAPTTGAATSSVHRTRCELKGLPYTIVDQEVNIFTVKSKMHQINWFGSIVVMQMHCDDGNDPTNKTFLAKNAAGVYQLLNGMRTEASTSDPSKELLLDNVDITKEFSMKYTITRSGVFTVEASQGENVGKIEKQLGDARKTRPHVFHLGVYNQIDMGSSSEPANDGSLIELMEFSEYHGDIPVVVPPVIDPYVAMQARIDALEDQYRVGLKALQTKIKTELNIITTDMKALTDKTRTAPMYTEILAFKADMTNGLVRTTETV